MSEEIVNTGVIHGRLDTDYLAGYNSPVGYEVVLPDGNWNPFIPTGERQKDGSGTDKMECVTQSFNKSVATQMNRLIKLNLMPQSHLKFLSDNGYLDASGRVNFNERISAILNETRPEGNSLSKVANKAREYGLFPHGIIPDNKALAWNEYYNRSIVTAKMLELGAKFKEYFTFTTEWIPVNPQAMLKELKHTPLQVVYPSHAVEEIYQPGDVEYYDSYGTIGNDRSFVKRKPFEKFTSAMKILLVLQKVKDQTRIFRVEQKGKLGLMFVEKQIISVQFEDDYQEYLAWLKSAKAENAPLITIPLGNHFRLNDNGTLGLLMVEGYAGAGFFEDKWDDFQTLLKISGVAPEAPMINLPQ